jgi:hypothetical protein
LNGARKERWGWAGKRKYGSTTGAKNYKQQTDHHWQTERYSWHAWAADRLI